MKIREAADADFGSIYRLNRDGLGYDYPEERTHDRLRLILSLATEKIFVAEAEGVIIGYIHLSNYECTYSDSVKNIMALSVREGFRRMGVGRLLLQTAEDWAKEDGAAGIRLVSGAHRTGAHAFYLACGYTLRKDQKNFIKLF